MYKFSISLSIPTIPLFSIKKIKVRAKTIYACIFTENGFQLMKNAFSSRENINNKNSFDFDPSSQLEASIAPQNLNLALSVLVRLKK